MIAAAVECDTLAAPSGPYAAGYKVDLMGADLLFISGQVAESSTEQCVGKGDTARQAEQALSNLCAVLEASGGKVTDVVKVTVFMRNMEDRDVVAEVRRRIFGDHRPASTLVEVSKLAHPDWLIEIDAIAVIRRSGRD